LYGNESWFLALVEALSPSMKDKLKEIFVSKRGDETRSSSRSHNEELHNFCSSSYTVTENKGRGRERYGHNM
jgi:hypothetical protein